jgi:cell division protein WhiA
MQPTASFTEAVRQELANRPVGDTVVVTAELASLGRFAGRLLRVGGDPSIRLVLTSASGAVARRAFRLLQYRYGVRAELAVRAPGGVHRRSTYEVRLADAQRIATDLGLVDASGRPVHRVPDDLDAKQAAAYLGGALMAAGSLSTPGRPAHLEIRTGSAAVADGLCALLGRELAGHAAPMTDERDRVVYKSGAAIGELLVLVGAPGAFMRWDERRFRHQLRSEANRLANADAANVNRTIRAASAQVRGVEEALEHLGLDGLDHDLREVALARLANPASSLQELGELLDPPVGKSTVHRRLTRLLRLAAERPRVPPTDDDP